MKKITSLTAAQERRIQEIRAEWISEAMRTDQSSDDEMRHAVANLYRTIGKAVPPIFVMDCPATSIIARAVVRANLAENLGANLAENLGANLRANLWANLGENLRANLRENLAENLRANLVENLWANLAENLGANLRENLAENLAENYDFASLWGAYDAGWVAFYDFPRELGVTYAPSDSERLSAIIAYARTCGWLYAYPGAAFVSRRNTVIRRDDAGRMHCETGPAMAFASGYAMHCWHGVRIPSEWIEQRQTLTAQTALTWPNIEQRRAACEIVGWHRILAELNAKTINKHVDPQVGELVEVTLPDSSRERFLRVLCGTGREFALPVPREMKSAIEAQAWTWGLDSKEFQKPEIRT